MAHKDPIYGAFHRARYGALGPNTRKVGWTLTFAQWWKIWEDSGHWYERGVKKGQYVMARNGDKGPYAVGNVRIILATDNTKEGWANDYVPKRRKNMRKKHEMSAEGSEILSRKVIESPPRLGTGGNKLPMKTRKLMGIAQRRRAEREGADHPLRRNRG